MRNGEGKRIVWTGFVSSYGARHLHLPFTVGLDNETYSHIIYLARQVTRIFAISLAFKKNSLCRSPISPNLKILAPKNKVYLTIYY